LPRKQHPHFQNCCSKKKTSVKNFLKQASTVSKNEASRNHPKSFRHVKHRIHNNEQPNEDKKCNQIQKVSTDANIKA